MPRVRADLHRATCKLDSCRQEFFQRKPDQEFCSQACSNKAFPGVGGRKPDAGLESRICENSTCGRSFQPYRASQRTCSRTCYRKLPDVVEKVRLHHDQQHIKDRKNAARRGTEATKRNRRRGQLKRYGMTVEDYDTKLEAQRGVCMICGRPPKPDGVRAASILHADHDHATGQNRDLLCSTCNYGLGCFKDDPDLLRVAALYVERHRGGALADRVGLSGAGTDASERYRTEVGTIVSVRGVDVS